MDTKQQPEALRLTDIARYCFRSEGMSDPPEQFESPTGDMVDYFDHVEIEKELLARITALESQLAQRFDAADLRAAAQAVVDRWDTPLWKDVPATAEYIGRLRAALAAGQATAAQAAQVGAVESNTADAAPTQGATEMENLQRTAVGWQGRALRAERNWAVCRRWAIAGGAPVEKLGDDPDQPFHAASLAAGQATAAQAVVQDDLITLRKPTTSAELLWLLKLAHLVISDVDKTLEETFAPAQPAAEASRFGSPELQAMIIARCVEKDQADSVPAVSDLPPLPAPDLRDVGTKPQEIKEFLKGYATEYARTAIAARAPADGVQEDAARLDFLIEQRAYVVSDPDTCTGYWLHWARPDGDTWVQVDKYPTPRAAIDAARKQEEKQ